MRLSKLIPFLLLAACTVGPDYRPPAPVGQAAWLEPADPAAVDPAWWDRFGDARLTALVERAMAKAGTAGLNSIIIATGRGAGEPRCRGGAKASRTPRCRIGDRECAEP